MLMSSVNIKEFKRVVFCQSATKYHFGTKGRIVMNDHGKVMQKVIVVDSFYHKRRFS